LEYKFSICIGVIKMEEYNIEKAYVGDFIGIRGTVKIENGEHVAIGRNHWVGQGLETIGNYIISSNSNLGAAGTNWTMRLGSDTSTTTTVSMTSLVSQIGGNPSSQTSWGTYYATSTTPVVLIWIATWNAGTVSGTLGEAGLYLYISYGALGNGTAASQPGLASRLSAADGSFTAFTINTAAALTVTWTVGLVYA
jgi:hypothetical protein